MEYQENKIEFIETDVVGLRQGIKGVGKCAKEYLRLKAIYGAAAAWYNKSSNTYGVFGLRNMEQQNDKK